MALRNRSYLAEKWETRLSDKERPRLVKPMGVPALVVVSGSQIGSSWRVGKISAKSVTIFSPGGTGRFAGKKYTYKWDGTGFKRQGGYLLHPKKGAV